MTIEEDEQFDGWRIESMNGDIQRRMVMKWRWMADGSNAVVMVTRGGGEGC
jgi:hypothetical protein